MSQDSARAEPRPVAALPGSFPLDAGFGGGVMGPCGGTVGLGTATSGYGGGLSAEMVAELNQQQFRTQWWQPSAQSRLPEHLRRSTPIGGTGRADVGVATLGAQGGMDVDWSEGAPFAGPGRTADGTPKHGQALPAENERARQGEEVGAVLQGVSRPMSSVPVLEASAPHLGGQSAPSSLVHVFRPNAKSPFKQVLHEGSVSHRVAGGPVLEPQNAQIRASESIPQRALCVKQVGVELCGGGLERTSTVKRKCQM